MELAIVILNWNAVDDTVQCIHHVSSWQHLHPPIWVVDNASTDGSLQVIASKFPEVRLIRNSTNLGFAGGNNRGIIGALSTADVPILLLSNKVYIEEQDVSRMLDTLKAEEQIGLVGPLIFDALEKNRLLAAGRKNPAMHRHLDIETVANCSPVQVVECLPGIAVIVRAKILREVGLLDVDYFYGNTVADLCLRARQHGYLSAVDIRAKAFYQPRDRSEFRHALYTYYIVRNRFLLIRKFHYRWQFLLYPAWTIQCMIEAAAVRSDYRRSTSQAIWLGLRDGLRGRFGRQNKRVLGAIFGSGGRFGS